MARGVNQEAVKIAERRKKVSELYLQHQTQASIARLLGVHQTTISDDLIAIRAQWKEEGLFNFDEVKQREAAELDVMEAAAAVEFSKRKNWEWFDRRLKCKERRAKLLGLDEPTRTESSGPKGAPIQVEGEFRVGEVKIHDARSRPDNL
jgi:predicted transcriptional regulator